MQAITPYSQPEILATLQDLTDQARATIGHAKAENTQRAYRTDFTHFTAWCATMGVSALPAAPSTVVLYLAALRNDDKKVSTLTRRISAISQAHQYAGIESPCQHAEVRAYMAGARREMGSAEKRAAPIMTEDVKAMVNALPDTLLGTRDKALLLVGFAGAFRESELVNLAVADVTFCVEGVRINLRHSKTDQSGEGREVGISRIANFEYCPVRALRAWLDAAGIVEGKVFRGMNRHGGFRSEQLAIRAVDDIIKRAAAAADLDATQLSGHSLRAGHATTAAREGVSEREIMDQTGHRSERMVRKYIRKGNLFSGNSSAKLGL